MNIVNDEKNNFFFANNCKSDLIKEKIILEQNSHRNSISTNETFENEFFSDDEDINFNQDFFPQNKMIKFTEILADYWEERIALFSENIKNKIINGHLNNI